MHASPLRGNRHRGSIRLKGYDYSQVGAYFVTICAKDRACLFGEVVDDGMRLNPEGLVVEQCWNAISEHFPSVALDEFVVMPNHVHGVLWITNTEPPRHTPLPHAPCGTQRGSIGAIVASFKSAVSKRINELRGTPGTPVWQRNDHDHIIRDEETLNRIRQYIVDNPVHWAMDHENPTH
jgi:REP element-mobilizing transposase RayT